MASNSFKVKNSLVLTPKNLSTITNPEAGDLACDINDNNKLKRYDTTTSSWIEVGSGGTTPLEIFNVTITKGSNATSVLGVLHFKASEDLQISYFRAQIFEKGATASGSLTVDVKKNTSPDSVGMTSVFSVLPSFNFSTISDYAQSSGTLSTTTVLQGEYLRLDLTSIPSTFTGTIQVLMYA